jgi:probable HAF family extracellular repeat protein
MKLRVLTILGVVLTQIAAAQNYRVIDLGPLQPVAINATGEIAGNYNNHAYVRIATGREIDLGLIPGGTFTLAAGINDLGAVAGTADGAPATVFDFGDPTNTANCTNLTQPFVWTAKKGFATAPAIPVVTGLWIVDPTHQRTACVHPVYATGLNNSGQVVASNNLDLGTYLNGYLWNTSHGVSLPGIDDQDSANAINDMGTIVGQSLVDNLFSHAFLWKGGVETALPALAAVSRCSGANSIDIRGTVAGWSAIDSTAVGPCYGFGVTPLPIHAVLWEKEVIKDLGTLPGDTSSVAVRISPTGVVIGTSGSTMIAGPVFAYAPEVVGRPFVWSRERGMEDLNERIDTHLGWVLNSVADINMWGQIVGTGTHAGQTHGFLLTPER